MISCRYEFACGDGAHVVRIPPGPPTNQHTYLFELGREKRAANVRALGALGFAVLDVNGQTFFAIAPANVKLRLRLPYRYAPRY
jgi:hypothetical protein